ncbi:MAG: PAS domain-containing protein [Phycisphaeraceae bacterium]|nr:PAS domain-containing protein [Phycisphaeraceae bacterium]
MADLWTRLLLVGGLTVLVGGPFLFWRFHSAGGRAPSRGSAGAFRRLSSVAGATFAIGTAISLSLAAHEHRRLNREADERFNLVASRTSHLFAERMRQPAALIGAKGLYHASARVEPAEFRTIINGYSEIGHLFPGTPFIGVLDVVTPGWVDAHQRAMHALGDASYAPRPDPAAPLHLLVRHAEPSEMAGPLVGADLSCFPGLLADLDACLENGESRLTASGRLTPSDPRTYHLWILPVYRQGRATGTPEERRAALDLVLFAPVCMETLGRQLISELEGLADLEIFEGPSRTLDHLRFDADGHLASHVGPVTPAAYEERSQGRFTQVLIGGRLWSLAITSTPTFESTLERAVPAAIAICGSALSLLLAGLLWSMGSARDRAEELLRESRGLRDAIQHRTIYSEADARGRITAVNDLFCAISGYSREELIGQDHRIVNSGHHPKSFWVDAWKTIASGQTWRGEVCNRAKDGSLFWVDTVIAPFMDANGRIDRYISLRFDITQTKQIQSAIAASEARFRTLVESANAIVWEFDCKANRFTYVSPQAARLGYPIEDWFRPNFWQDTLHEDDRDRAIDYCFRETLAGRAHRFQYRMRRADGSIVHIDDVVTVEMTQGKPSIMRGILVDVSEQIAQRQILREQAERLDLTVRSARIGTWDWEIDSGRVTFNDVAQTMHGYKPGEWEPNVGAWGRLIHPDDLPEAWRRLNEHLEGRTEEYRFEHRLLRKDGTWAWILDAGRVTERDADGRARRAMGVHVDITSVKAAADALAEATALAESANRAKSEFLANMSHEIRTPMTAILGYADLLSDCSEEERETYIDTIKRNSDHLLSIINDILDVSKIEAGKMTVESVPVDPALVLGDIASLMAVKARARGISFSLEHDTPLPPTIRTDPVRLRQILLNLVGNAIKFTEIGGITVRAAFEPDAPAGPRLRLTISDTGIGMTREQVDRLFAAFQQADSSTTRRFGGSGLGLRISRSLANLLGGDISVSSQPGRGSTFTVTIAAAPISVPSTSLPAAPRTDHSISAEPPADHAPLKGRRILLAEDGPDNQRLIAFHLRKAGATVIPCDNGLAALKALTADGSHAGPLAPPAFDLILTDIQMPEMDGYTFARTLRDRGWTRPIIALTAHAMAGDADKCLSAGCNAYLSKPIDRVSLVERCREFLDQPVTHAA